MNTLRSITDKQIGITLLLVVLGLTPACAAQKPKSAEDKPAEAKVAEPPTQITPAQVTSQKPTTSAPVPKTGPDNPANRIYLGSDGKMAGRGSPDRPASEVVRIARGTHPSALSLPGLPKDKFGLIDWNSMIKNKVINPVGSLKVGAVEIPPFDLDVVIHAKSDFVQNVVFPHKAHTYWLDCINCHTGIFIMGKGKNKMSMQEIVQGEWCGRCHGKIAFPLTDCNRCHSKPQH